MKVIILCGGFGTRIRDVAENIPKPMIPIGRYPILWHIMKTYSHYGYSDFILCLGYKGEIIKQYFLNYQFLDNDFVVDLQKGATEIPFKRNATDWRVTLVDTGLEAMTGARVKRVARYVDTSDFMLTYGDGVSDLNIQELLDFHRSHGKIGTVTGVCPASRYGELVIQGNRVKSFMEKPQTQDSFISGGYFVFKREFFDCLSESDDCVLERGPFERLVAQGELMVYSHKGFWQCMDTPRDLEFLTSLWRQGSPPWEVWSR
ncbi:glucose-1-phosphate cytidylyltransferase [Acidobacteria bacterium AH-259-O06]|nr:glucose-1-phosphate cytidylyltransferase [Acidobacteria bacterium AH-259-O06]